MFESLLLKIETPLEEGSFEIERFDGTEGLSKLFQFEAHLYSAKNDIEFDELVGKSATVTLATYRSEPRYFNGLISSITQVGRDERGWIYQLRLVPWLWLLSLRSRSRIFQNQTVEEILRTLFAEHPVDYELSSPGAALPYCAQYEESDLNFALRILEAHGLSFYFVHQRGKHKLVVRDVKTKPAACPGQSRLSVQLEDSRREGVISSWQPVRRLTSMGQRLVAYDYMNPRADLLVASQKCSDDTTHFEFSGSYIDEEEGRKLAQRYADGQAVRLREVEGTSSVRTLQPGFVFELGQHERKALVGTRYVLTAVTHQAHQSPGAYGQPYANSFRCVPVGTPLVPPRLTPKPRICGVQTAMVVAPDKGEIKSDKLRRVLVQFHWDLQGDWKKDGLCFLRVAQAWAGNRYGIHFTPRVGQEVLVCFIDGDPDQPIIIGGAHNAKQPPPFASPTQSGIKTNSSKGGDGYNALRFEDAKGSEQIYLHAERDFDLRIKADLRDYVGKNHHAIVKETRNEEIGKDLLIKVGEKLILDAGKSLTLKVGGTFIELTEQEIVIQGQKVKINCGGSAQSISEPPKEAATDEPGAVDTPPRA